MGILRACARVFKWLPVVFITAIIAWSYYAYVIQLCIFTVDNILEKVVYMVFYHLFLFLFLWAYYKTIWVSIATIPKEFYLTDADIDRLENEERGDRQDAILKQIAKNLPVSTRTLAGGIRYCDICRAIKPDRCHHCSVCETCVLKMDHHCPWVNNCVGFSNYKFFILFLMYGLLYCLYVAATVLQYFIEFWSNTLGSTPGKFHILFLFFAAAMFALSLISLFGYHCYLVSVNKTTLESFRTPVFSSGPDKDGFSMNTKLENIKQVFGEDIKQWWMPVFASYGDGRCFPTRTESEDSDHLLAERQRWAEEGMESDTTNTEDNIKIDICNSGRSAHYATSEQQCPQPSLEPNGLTAVTIDPEAGYDNKSNSIDHHHM
ncbi:palmitoyltransferase ZDHHC15B-like [Saccoglossus kowalevskii]|uniref:Palmitoyltransferase n=1 Tax=Saccoglossus kowalevskii TaxID=10224 RepID=A0ABM0ME66_SACKO|nr:PREDICTED: palmitoyltransferase ZDHHC2-like [Saccoglossus kowalevskii]